MDTSAIDPEALTEFMYEFDKVQNIIASGGSVEDIIEDDATREACSILAALASNCRISYAIIRHNSNLRLEAAESPIGPQAFRPDDNG